MPYKDITPPAGEKITRGQTLNVPDRPVIPFIRGDGTGPDIWAASVRVFDAAVEKAFGGKKKIAWFEVFAGQVAKDKFDEWLPDDTVEAFREFLVGIKGPLTTPLARPKRKRSSISCKKNFQRSSTKSVSAPGKKQPISGKESAHRKATRFAWELGSNRSVAPEACA